MPNGPLAHICLLVADLDQAIEDWTKILQELDPGQLVEPTVRMDDFVAGEDVMNWATFVNPNGCEIQLMAPTNDGPLGQRLAKRGEGVHHICFTTTDLKGAVKRMAANGVELTSEEVVQDPSLPWQWWTFISPKTTHGPLVEVAHPYKPVDGRWEPGDGVPSAEEFAKL